MRRLFGTAIVTLAVLTAGGAIRAGESKSLDEEEQAIRSNTAALIAALNGGDAEAMADLWTEDGDLLTLAGEMCCGRETLKKQLKTGKNRYNSTGVMRCIFIMSGACLNPPIQNWII